MPWSIGIVHPAFLLRGSGNFAFPTILDLAKIQEMAARGGPSWDDGRLISEPLPANQVKAWLEQTIKSGCRTGVDVENQRVYRGRSILTHVGIARGYDGDVRSPDRSALCISLVNYGGQPTYGQPALETVRLAIRAFMRGPNPKTLQNGSHDVDVLNFAGLGPVENYDHDTLIAHQCVCAELPHDLAFLGATYLDAPAWKQEVKGGGELTDRVSERDFRLYNAKDAARTLALDPPLHRPIHAEKVLTSFYDRKMRAGHLARRIGARGFYVDQDRLKETREAFAAKLEKNLKRMRDAVQSPHLDPNKTRVLRKIIYEYFDAPILSRTAKTRQGRLTADLLPRLRRHLPPEGREFVDAYLEWKAAAKVESTYLRHGWRSRDGKLHGLELIDGSAHSLFSVTVTPTDRWASRDPNMQNIPEGVPEDPFTNIRRIYRARPGFTLIGFDFAALELRIDAFQSGDDALIQVFAEDLRMRRQGIPKELRPDIHRINAAAVFGVAEALVTKLMRKTAKNVVYGTGYGGGPETILGTIQANALDNGDPVEIRAAFALSVKSIAAMLENWFKNHPGLWRHRQEKIASAVGRSRTGCGAGLQLQHVTEYQGGRRRWFLKGRVPHGAWDGGADRRGNPSMTQVLNGEVQTEASRLFEETALAIDRDIQGGRLGRWSESEERQGLCAGIVNPLHDALYLECPEGKEDEAVAMCVEHAEKTQVGGWVYPVDAKTGTYWSEF